MSTETQKTIVKQFFYDVLRDGKLEVLERILNPECPYYDGGELKYTTREEFIEYVGEARKSFTSIDVVIDEMIAEGDKVAVRCTYYLDTEVIRSTFSVMGFFQFHELIIVKIWRVIVISNQQEKTPG
jgi:predicted SnoaL-like aldol condensation-catalyzing enzyme